MVYEIYSYWNLAELQGAFNAIAALTASSNFTGLLRLLALVAIVSLVLAVLAGRARHEDFWRWVIMLALVNGMMLVPKVTVVLVDRTSSQPSRVVDNVPIGLAALAHGTSKIGDWLTRAYETTFALPNDLQFQKNGLMFGHRILTESVKWTPEMVNGTWMRDFQEFWRECVMPDIASGYLSVDTLRGSHNFWGELNNTNPALYVTLTTTGTVSCPQAYTDLTNRLNNTVVPAIIQLQADMHFPGVPGNAAQMKNAIASAYGYGLNVVNTPESIVKQQMSINAAITAYCGTFAQLGDSNKAALCYSTSMGANQTNYTYQVLAKIAESSMPKLKSAIELIQYSVFPIIIAFAVVAGHLGLGVLKTYLMSLVWVQLWPPLYAVVHYIQTSKLPEYANQLAGLGDTMQGQIDLLNMGVSDQAIAGMLVVAIPPIAAALVKGGEVGLHAVAGLVSAPRTAERQAADNAKGNESAGQWNTAPTVRHGAMVSTSVGESGIVTHTFANGFSATDASQIGHRMNLRINAGSRISAALQQQSEQAETAAVGEVVSAGNETAAVFQKLGDFVRAHARGASSGTSVGESDAAKISKAYSEAQDIARNFEKQHGLSEGMGAKVMGSLAARGGLELAGNGVKAQLKAMGLSEATLSDEKKMAEAVKQAKSFRDAMERVHEVSRQSKYDTGESSEAKAMQGIRASLDQAQRHSEQASASHQRSLALKESASRARENSGAWEAGMLRQFVDWMATQHNAYAGRNFDAVTVAEMAEKNPELLTPFVDRFFKERVEPALSAGAGELKTPEDVQKFFKDGKAQVPSADTVAQQGEKFLANVQSAAASAGVDPAKGVTSALPQRVAKEMGRIGKAIDGGKEKAEAGGKPIESTVTDAVQHPGSLAAKAASNASTSVLPQGTTYLLDKVGATPGAFAKHEAENYKGTDKDAWTETFILGATTLLGGVAGHAVGKVGGSIVGRKAGNEAFEAAINKATGPGHVGPPTRDVMQQALDASEDALKQKVKAWARDGVKVGFGAGAVVGKTVADNPNQVSQSVIQWNQDINDGVGRLLPGGTHGPINPALEGTLKGGEKEIREMLLGSWVQGGQPAPTGQPVQPVQPVIGQVGGGYGQGVEQPAQGGQPVQGGQPAPLSEAPALDLGKVGQALTGGQKPAQVTAGQEAVSEDKDTHRDAPPPSGR